MLGAALMNPMVHPQTQPHLLTEDKEQDEGYYFWMQPTHSVKLTKMQQYNKKLSISHMCKFFLMCLGPRITISRFGAWQWF